MCNMSLRAILATIFLVVVAGCATNPPPEPLGAPIDIYLLPVDDFSFEFADQLARRLSRELNLNVRASLSMGASDVKELPNSSQLAVEDIIARVHEVGLRLPNKNQKFVVIALTTRDINDRSQSMRFLFSKNDRTTQTSVISIARMFSSTPSTEGTQAQVGLRIYKMTKRAIGEQYFGLGRTANIADIMYAPIMSLEDIDAMGLDYKELRTSNTPGPTHTQSGSALSVKSSKVTDDTYYSSNQVNVHPKTLTPIQPLFPEEATKENLSGEVTLQLLIDETGKVRDLAVLTAKPEGYFEQSALDAFRNSHWAPAQKDGHVVKSRVLIHVKFSPVNSPRRAQ